MTAQLITGFPRATDANGAVLPGAKLYLYATGTTTLQSGYADSGITTPLSNPVVADAGGLFPSIYLDASKIYRAYLTTSAGALVQDIDPVSDGALGALAASSGAALIGVSGGGTVQGFINSPAVTSSGPAWASYNTAFNASTVNINSFPATSQFGNNTSGIVQSFAGLLNIPSSDVAGNHGAGIAGYARSASTSKGAVGVFGAGLANAAGVSTWGFNSVSTNAPATNPSTGTGLDNCTVYGYEIDFNLKKVGAAAPNYALIGIYLTGDSESAPAGGTSATVRAIDVDSFGINQVPKLKWNDAFYIRDGAATNALNIGTTGTGNNVGSQPIVMRSRTSGGVNSTSSITADANGNLVISAASGSVLSLYNGASEMLASIPGVGTRIQTAFQINGTQVLGPRATGWTAATNTSSRATFDTTTVTTAQLAQRVKALIDDLMTHGVIGT